MEIRSHSYIKYNIFYIKYNIILTTLILILLDFVEFIFVFLLESISLFLMLRIKKLRVG